jgi:hypothetical protein
LEQTACPISTEAEHKYGRLCNFAPRDAHDLNEAVVRELDAVRENQGLLSSFFHQSDLPLPRALLT